MVEVFKTNVSSEGHATTLIGLLQLAFPNHKINFDLDDCDRILRIEGHSISPESIITLLKENNCDGEVL